MRLARTRRRRTLSGNPPDPRCWRGGLWLSFALAAGALPLCACWSCGPIASDTWQAAASQHGTAIGIFDLPSAQVGHWSVTVIRAGPRDLPAIRAHGVQALIALTGARWRFSDRRGCFSLPLWKRALDRYDRKEIQSYVSDGTIIGLYAMDEPHDWSCGPSFADIDAACAYAASKWPAMPCGVNAPPAWLARGRGQLEHIGFLFTQYSARQGVPAEWLRRQYHDSSWHHGDLWLSIQLLQPRLSVAEFREVALTFCGARPRGVMLWKWSPEWFSQAGVKEAMAIVARTCGRADRRTPVNRSQ